MKNSAFELESFALDEFGRVVLSDDLIDKIECSQDITLAGANSYDCGLSSNTSCTNSGSCGYSSNSWCSNPSSCTGSTNSYWCT